MQELVLDMLVSFSVGPAWLTAVAYLRDQQYPKTINFFFRKKILFFQTVQS